jgi:hypothetical protein
VEEEAVEKEAVEEETRMMITMKGRVATWTGIATKTRTWMG